MQLLEKQYVSEIDAIEGFFKVPGLSTSKQWKDLSSRLASSRNMTVSYMIDDEEWDITAEEHDVFDFSLCNYKNGKYLVGVPKENGKSVMRITVPTDNDTSSRFVFLCMIEAEFEQDTHLDGRQDENTLKRQLEDKTFFSEWEPACEQILLEKMTSIMNEYVHQAAKDLPADLFDLNVGISKNVMRSLSENKRYMTDLKEYLVSGENLETSLEEVADRVVNDIGTIIDIIENYIDAPLSKEQADMIIEDAIDKILDDRHFDDMTENGLWISDSLFVGNMKLFLFEKADDSGIWKAVISNRSESAQMFAEGNDPQQALMNLFGNDVFNEILDYPKDLVVAEVSIDDGSRNYRLPKASWDEDGTSQELSTTRG